MNLCGQDGDVWKLLDDRLSTVRCGEEAEENDVSGLDAVLDQHLHCLDNRVPCAEDGVHEQDFSSVYVWGELGVVDFGFLRLLVALDEDLADAYGAAAVAQALLHGLTASHYADSTVAPFKFHTFVLVSCRRGHSALRVRQLVQTLFHH